MSGDDRGASSTNKGSCTSNKNNISNEKGWTTTSSSKPITEDKPIGSLMLVASCGRNASINIFHNEPPSATINALSTFKEQTAPSSLDSLGYTDRSDVPIRDKLVLTRSDTKPNPTEENAENDVRSHLCYRDDQWSPANTDGKKVYPRDFLLALSKDTLSLKKPDNLPKEIRRNDDKAEQVYDITIFSMEARAGPDFSPSFNSNSYSNKSPLQLGVRAYVPQSQMRPQTQQSYLSQPPAPTNQTRLPNHRQSQQAICQPQPAQYLQMPLSTHHMTYIKSSPMPVQYNSNSRPPNYVTSGYPMIIPQLQGYSYQQPSQAHPQSYFFNPPTQLISRTQPSPAPNMVDGSPAPSGESSARQTPQPSQPNPNKEFQAAFAKHAAFAKLVAQAQVQAAPQNPTQPSPASNMVMQQPVLPHNTVAKNKRRSNAIPIIDINTGRDRLNEMYEQEQDGSPPPSGESSARQTPQPSQPKPNKEFQAAFAKHVAFAKLVAQAQVQAAPQNPTQPSPASNMVMQQPVLPHNTVAKNKRRSNAIPIIDINTGRDRLNEMYEQEQDGSPPPSGESSARQTPQPSQPNPNKEFQAAFAKHVAFAKLVAQAQVQAAPQNPTQPSPASNMVMQQPVLPQNTVAKNKRRSNAIPIIDINTGRDRLNEMYEQEQDGSPPPSGESSARQTPQPSQPNPNKEFQYKFQDKLNSKPPTGDKPFASSSKFISWGGIPCIKEADLYRNHCGVSNKVAPQKFDILLDQIRNLHINDPQRLQEIVDLVYEKAINEPNFSPAYALLCRELAFMKVPLNIEADKGKEDAAEAVSKEEGLTEYVIFRKLLITRCQMEFEKKSMNESASNPKVELIESCLDAETKKEMLRELEEYHRKLRMKSVGNIIFFGELFKQNMLTVHMMQRCVSTFLEAKDEESCECLCALLTTTGLVLESKKFNMTPVFNAIQDIVDNKSGNISSRVRFMLQDVIDLWFFNWVPQGQDLNHVQPLTTNSTNMNAAIDALANEFDRKNFNIRWGMKNLTIPNKTPTVTASECNATPAAPAQVNK